MENNGQSGAVEEDYGERQRREEGESEIKKTRRKLIALVAVALLLLAGGVAALIWMLSDEADREGELASGDDGGSAGVEEEEAPKYYSSLTGLPIANAEANKEPTFCVQVPNGMDGARPQAGLASAGVMFEAIAERGITRFAAIFQGGETAVIGPMRSLRLYYLQWDTPFDCTIIHDGGADDALAAVRSYKDFNSFGNYVWRSSTNTTVNRRWNNEFTSGALLMKYNQDRGYGDASDVQGFRHLTPEQALMQRVRALAANPLDIDTETEGSTSKLELQASAVRLAFGNMPNYNPVYTYDAESNTYKRGYESGAAHMVYDCAGQSEGVTPENACQEVQLAPSVVVAMVVEQHEAADGYHEEIKTTGSGKAYIFQGGMAIEGVWKKGSVGEQIRFYDQSDTEIALAPGQVIVSAVPQYGKVSWE